MSYRPCLAVLVCAALAGPAAAKPPGLPAEPEITCEECPGAGDCLFAGDDAPACPFRGCQPALPPARPSAADLADSTLDNLRKLARAARDLDAADALWDAGQPLAATERYQAVAGAVPGSRLARRAGERLALWVAMQEAAERGPAAGDAEEASAEDEPVGPPCEAGAGPAGLIGRLAGCCAAVNIEVEIDAGGRVKARVRFEDCPGPEAARALGEYLADWAGTLGGRAPGERD